MPNAGNAMSSVKLRCRGVLKLVRDLLEHAQLTQSMVALEREAGLSPDEYPAELVFFRDLILEGEWSEVVNLVQLLAHSDSYSDVMYAVERQRFLELLHTRGQPSPPPPGTCPAPRSGEIQEHLQRLERLCPNRTEFATLSYLITLPNLTDHPVFSDWEVKPSRHQLFQCVGRQMAEAIYHGAVDRVFPLSTSGDLASDRLVQLVAKGLLYEQCEATVVEHLVGTPCQPQGIVDLQKCISAVLTRSRQHELISQTVSVEVEDRMQPIAERDGLVSQRLSAAKSSASLVGYSDRVPPPANGRWHVGDVYTLSGGRPTVSWVHLPPEPSHTHNVAIPQRPKTVACFGQTQTPLVEHTALEKARDQTDEVVGVDEEYPGAISCSPSTCPAGIVPSTPTAARGSPAVAGKDMVPLQITLFSPLAEEERNQSHHSNLVSSSEPPERDVKQSSVLQKQLMSDQPGAQSGLTKPSDPVPRHASFQSLPATTSGPWVERTASQRSANLHEPDPAPPSAPPETRSPPAATVSSQAHRSEGGEGGILADLQPSLALHHPPSQAANPVSNEGMSQAAGSSAVKVPEGVPHFSRIATPDLALPPETAIDSSTPKPAHSRLVGRAGGVPPTSPVPYVSGTHGLSDTPHRRGVRLRKTLSEAMEEVGGGGSSQGLASQQAEPTAAGPGSPHGMGHPVQEALHTPPDTKVPDPSELPRLECLGCVTDRQVVRAVAFDPLGQLVAVGANSHCLRVCSAEAMLTRPPGESSVELPLLYTHPSYHQGSIYCLAWNSAHLLASGSNDQTVRLMRFDPQDGLPASAPSDLHIHQSTVRDVAFLNNDLLVSAGSGDCVVKLVECRTQSLLLDLRGHVEQILALAVHKGQTVLSAGQDKLVKCWDVASKSAVGSIHLSSPVGSLDVRDTTLAAACLDGSLSLYDLRMLDSAYPLSSSRLHNNECRSVRFSPDGWFLLTGSYDRSVRATLGSSMRSEVVATHRDKVIQCRWHPSGQVCASTGVDKKACFWRVTC